MSSLDLDSILDEALDEFEKQSIVEQTATVLTEEKRAPVPGITMDDEKVRNIEYMERMLSSLENPEYGQVLQDTLKQLSSSAGGNRTVEDLFAQLGAGFNVDQDLNRFPKDANDADGIEGADRKIAATLDMLGRAQQGMQGFEVNKIEEAGETMMEDMMAEFEALGEKEDYNEVIDGVMRQLLSRDLMYEPVKQICEKFPEWLATHRDTLSQEEYVNHGLQYQTFQKLLAVYDTEPDNFPRIMELMFDMQNYGQPPADIIKDLAPGLKFDENGMPIMPNMGAGMFPEGMMAGGEGLPDLSNLSGKMAEGQCSVM